MSSRELRRRRQEHEAAAAIDASPSADSADDADEDDAPGAVALNPFELLGADNDEEEEESDVEQPDPAADASPLPPPQQVPPPRPTSSASKKKNKKKYKTKTKKKTPVKSDSDDSLGDFPVVTDAEEDEESGEQPAEEAVVPLLAFTAGGNQLNEAAEMRRLFKTAAVKNSSVNRGQMSLAPHRQWLASLAGSPVMSLRMQPATASTSDSDGNRWFAFETSPAFNQVHCDFLDALRSMDIERVMELTQRYPRHPSPLLHLAWQNCQTGDYGTAGEYVVRALYLYQQAFHSAFNLLHYHAVESSARGKQKMAPALNEDRLTSATALDLLLGQSCRLSYYCAPNRPFFLALYCHIQLLCRRGMWHTAFAYCRALLRLDPEMDPTGAWLLVDFVACRASQWRWVLDVWQRFGENYSPDATTKNVGVRWYPNWCYSAALASFHIDGMSQESNRLLEQAIIAFPRVAVALIERCVGSLTIDADTTQLLSSSSEYFYGEVSGHAVLLSKLYVERSASLWKDSALSDWFCACLSGAARRVAAGNDGWCAEVKMAHQRLFSNRNLPRAVYRHLYLADFVSSQTGGMGGGQAPGTSLLNSHLPLAWREGPESLTPWTAEIMQGHDPFPPVSIPASGSGAARWTHGAITIIAPYDGYYRARILAACPQLAPLLLTNDTDNNNNNNNNNNSSWGKSLLSAVGWSQPSSSESGDADSNGGARQTVIIRRLQDLGLSPPTIPADVHRQLVATLTESTSSSSGGNTTAQSSMLAMMMASIMPGWSVAGLSSTTTNRSDMDYLDIPGFIGFLQNRRSVPQ